MDPLTGAHSIQAFLAEPGRPWAAFFDIDLFRAHNDTHGMQTADRDLVAVAGALGRALQPVPLFRVGGDEFAAYLESADENRVRRALQAVIDLSVPFSHPGVRRPHRDCLTVSACLIPTHGSSGRELLERLGDAVYHAKTRGPGEVWVERG